VNVTPITTTQAVPTTTLTWAARPRRSPP
jgi:hypothetical protein